MSQVTRSTDAPVVYLTPPQIAKQLRVSNSKVLGWIRRAELKAVNVGNGARPRYRISPENFALFLVSREVQPPPTRVRRRRRTPPGGPLDPVLGEQLLERQQAVKLGKQYFRIWDGTVLFY